MDALHVESVATDQLAPYAGNAKIHTREQIRQIVKSIEEFGFNDPVAIWHGEIVEGHGRVMAAKELGMPKVPVIVLDHLTDEQRRAYTHVHNQLTMNTGWDWDTLLEDLEDLDYDFSSFGFDIPEDEEGEERESESGDDQPILVTKFGFVPFSIIRTTSGEWKSRKAMWMDFGIRSEVGRS